MLGALAIALSLLVTARASRAASFPIDRAVVRFAARETGGSASPRFVFERELAFEARIEALSARASLDPTANEPYRERDVRAALERHIAETVLESLGVDPKPTEIAISARMEQARIALIERVGGLVPLSQAERAEGIAGSELSRLLRREAIASLYLDRMVTPMLNPSEAELRSVLQTQRTPFSGRPFSEVESSLRRWYVGIRLANALEAFYDGLRTRLSVTVLQ